MKEAQAFWGGASLRSSVLSFATVDLLASLWLLGYTAAGKITLFGDSGVLSILACACLAVLSLSGLVGAYRNGFGKALWALDAYVFALVPQFLVYVGSHGYLLHSVGAKCHDRFFVDDDIHSCKTTATAVMAVSLAMVVIIRAYFIWIAWSFERQVRKAHSQYQPMFDQNMNS